MKRLAVVFLLLSSVTHAQSSGTTAVPQSPPIPTAIDMLSQSVANYAKENATLANEVLTLRKAVIQLHDANETLKKQIKDMPEAKAAPKVPEHVVPLPPERSDLQIYERK